MEDKDAIIVSIAIITSRVLQTVIVGSRLVIFIMPFHQNAIGMRVVGKAVGMRVVSNFTVFH